MRWISLVMLGLCFIACDESTGGPDPDSDTAMDTTDADATEIADMNPDDARDLVEDIELDVQDIDPDVPSPTCEFPTPAVGTGVIVDQPGECGLDYQWVAPDTMGDLVAWDAERNGFQASLLAVVLPGIGVINTPPPIHDTSVRKFEYVTQDQGQATVATAFVAWPTTMDADAPLPMILFTHGTTGFSDMCAASNSAEYPALAAYLASLGYIVVAPDFLGMKGFNTPSAAVHPYLIGQPTAIASLDAVRAVGKMDPADLNGLCPSQRTIVFGPSQGGHAALWVDRMAGYYAPEIDLVGTVAAVPVNSLVGQLDRGLTELAGVTQFASGFLAAASVWYDVQDQLPGLFEPPLSMDIVGDLETTCSAGSLLNGATTIDDVFTQATRDAVTTGGVVSLDPWGCIISANDPLTTAIPHLTARPAGYGVLFVLGELDDIVNPAIEQAGFDVACAAGRSLEYLECAGADHVEAVFWSLPEIIGFMEQRFAGVAPEASAQCDRSAGATVCTGTPP